VNSRGGGLKKGNFERNFIDYHNKLNITLVFMVVINFSLFWWEQNNMDSFPNLIFVNFASK